MQGLASFRILLYKIHQKLSSLTNFLGQFLDIFDEICSFLLMILGGVGWTIAHYIAQYAKRRHERTYRSAAQSHPRSFELQDKTEVHVFAISVNLKEKWKRIGRRVIKRNSKGSIVRQSMQSGCSENDIGSDRLFIHGLYAFSSYFTVRLYSRSILTSFKNQFGVYQASRRRRSLTSFHFFSKNKKKIKK